jgi:glutathione S-transferase
MESKYKVLYWPGNGRAATMRAILTYSKANWEDKKIWGEEWETFKQTGTLKYKQLPSLEVDGKWLEKATAIDVFLAKRFNLLGDSDDDLIEIISLLQTREDLAFSLNSLLFPSEEEKTRKEEILANAKGTILPDMLVAWEKVYEAKHGKYFLGDKFSVADIYITCIVESVFNLPTFKALGFDELVAKHAPKLAAHIENIKNNELADYFKNIFLSNATF